MGRSVGPKTGATESASELTVGVAGFEPTASSSRTKRATKLRHTPVRHFCNPLMIAESAVQCETSASRQLAHLRARPVGALAGADRLDQGRRRRGQAPGRRRRARPAFDQGRTTSSTMASGLHAKRTGAKGEAPRPAETLTHAPGCVATAAPSCRMTSPASGHL